MNAFRTVFTERHTFLPVIHIHKAGTTLQSSDIGQVVRNVDIAQSCDADGVFLIGHGHVNSLDLLDVFRAVRHRYPDFWIGLNFLKLLNHDAVSRMPENECGLWSDDAGITDTSETDAKDFHHVCALSCWKGIYFGGVAFKYQAQPANLAAVASRSIEYVDVVTTSSEATGSAPSPEKIKTMKHAIGEHPLAIASGMSPDNIDQFHAADCFLVATGISKSFYDLDPRLVRAFSRRLDHSSYEPLVRVS